MDRGKVTGISRATGTCSVKLLSGPTVTAQYMDEPPCPWSVAFVERLGNGAWLVVGSPVDVLFREHWATAHGSGGDMWGDTYWYAQSGGAWNGVINDQASTVADTTSRHGVLACFAGTTANGWVRICKAENNYLNPVAPAAVWIAGKGRTTSTSNVLFALGLGNNAYQGFPGAAAGRFHLSVCFDSSWGTGAWGLNQVNGARGLATQDLVLGAVNTAAWADFDLLVNDSVVAVWINGVGPYYSTDTTYLPAASTSG